MKCFVFLITCLAAANAEITYLCYQGEMAKGEGPPTTRVSCQGSIPVCVKAVGDLKTSYGCFWDLMRTDCESYNEFCRTFHEAFACQGSLCNASTSIQATAVLTAAAIAIAKIMA